MARHQPRHAHAPRRSLTFRSLLAGAMVAAIASGTTLALGAIVNTGTVNTCVNTTTGAWRVLPKGSCVAGETAVKLYTKSGADAAFLTRATADGRYLR